MGSERSCPRSGPIAMQPTFSAGVPHVLFEGRLDGPVVTGDANFDVAADGRFLMFESAQSSAPSQSTVVLDWATELARRADQVKG